MNENVNFKNRLKIYGFLNREDVDMEEIDVLNELIERLKNADGYMLTASIITGEKLEHTLITDKFNKIDMIPSYKKLRDLIIRELEEGGV